MQFKLLLITLLLVVGASFVIGGGTPSTQIDGTVRNSTGAIMIGVDVTVTCRSASKLTITNSLGQYTSLWTPSTCNTGDVVMVNCGNNEGYNIRYLGSGSNFDCTYGDNYIGGKTYTRGNITLDNVLVNTTVNGTNFINTSDSDSFYVQKITSTKNSSDIANINISYTGIMNNFTTTINSIYNPTFYSNLFMPTKPTLINTSAMVVGTNATFSASGSTDADGDAITYYYEFYDINDSITLKSYSTSNYLLLLNNMSYHVLNVKVKSYDTTNYSNITELNYTITDDLSITP